MLRTALRPRFLGLLGLVLVVGAAFVLLGRWQLGVAEQTAHREAVEVARARTPVALTSVLRPNERFRGELSSRPVTATGRYAEGQVTVPDRRLDGREGSWVLTPFVVDGSGGTIAVLRGFVEDAAAAGPPPAGPLTSVLRPNERFRGELSSRPVTATGRYAEGQVTVPDRRLGGREGSWVLTPFVVDGSGGTIAVLRGFVEDAAAAGPPPAGPLTITGGLAPGESPSRTPVGPGQVASVDLSVLVNTWSGDLYNGFVFLEEEDPAATPDAAIARVPTPLGETGIRWRNAAYAVQWWIFAGFALWLWWRMVRDEARREDAPDAVAPEGGAAPPSDDDQDPVPAPASRTTVAAGENGTRDDA